VTPDLLRRARLGDQAALGALACDAPTFALVDALGGFGPGGVPARPSACQASAALRAWHRAAGWRSDGAAVVSPTGAVRLSFRARSIVVQRAERDALGRTRWVRHGTVPLQATVRQLAGKRGSCPRRPAAANPPWSPAELYHLRRQLEDQGLDPVTIERVLRGELAPPRPPAPGLPVAARGYLNERRPPAGLARSANPPAGDAHLRELERAWRTSGAADDWDRLVAERLRRGQGAPGESITAPFVGLDAWKPAEARECYLGAPDVAYCVAKVGRFYFVFRAHRTSGRWWLEHVPLTTMTAGRGNDWYFKTTSLRVAREVAAAAARRDLESPRTWWDDLSQEQRAAFSASRLDELQAVHDRTYPTAAYFDDEQVQVLGPLPRLVGTPYYDPVRAADPRYSGELIIVHAGGRRGQVSAAALSDEPNGRTWLTSAPLERDRRSPWERSIHAEAAAVAQAKAERKAAKRARKKK
jgi:hypothetical protein